MIVLCTERCALLLLKARLLEFPTVFGFTSFMLILSGTRTLNFFGNDSCDSESVYLLAIKELPLSEAIHNKVYGVCFIDTCVGNFMVQHVNCCHGDTFEVSVVAVGAV